jgi:hypothetical protein
MTDPHYILEYMQDNDLRYFQVANQFNRDVVVSFNDRSLEDGVEKMRKFLSKNTGFHRIKLYSNNDLKTNGVPRQEPQVFEVSITGKEFDPPKEDSAPITGFGVNPGYPSAGGIIGVEQYLSKHEENATLREKIKGLELELQYLRDQHNREIERLRNDQEIALKAAKDSNQMFSQGLGMLMNRMGVGE